MTILLDVLFFFFFSSRRRHTRYIGDWSSDVCSSDLGHGPERLERYHGPRRLPGDDRNGELLEAAHGIPNEPLQPDHRSEERRVGKECRSRGWRYQKKKKNRTHTETTT